MRKCGMQSLTLCSLCSLSFTAGRGCSERPQTSLLTTSFPPRSQSQADRHQENTRWQVSPCVFSVMLRNSQRGKSEAVILDRIKFNFPGKLFHSGLTFKVLGFYRINVCKNGVCQYIPQKWRNERIWFDWFIFGHHQCNFLRSQTPRVLTDGSRTRLSLIDTWLTIQPPRKDGGVRIKE